MARKAKLPPLSENQTDIMNVVWERGEANVAQVREALSERRQVSRNTVQTVLTRLARKGWLRRRKEGNAHYYSATVSRRKTLSRAARHLVDTVFAGSADGLVLALLDERGISDEERSRIREMIGEAKRSGAPKTGK